jgi:hypothetical protein
VIFGEATGRSEPRTTVAVVGSRIVLPRDLRRLQLLVGRMVLQPNVRTVVFGTNPGAEIEALQAAAKARVLCRGPRPRLVAVVPQTSDDLIGVPACAVCEHADEIRELRLDAGQAAAGLETMRNVVEGAGRLVAFWNGGEGHVKRTVAWATACGVDVDVVSLASS